MQRTLNVLCKRDLPLCAITLTWASVHNRSRWFHRTWPSQSWHCFCPKLWPWTSMLWPWPSWVTWCGVVCYAVFWYSCQHGRSWKDLNWKNKYWLYSVTKLVTKRDTKIGHFTVAIKGLIIGGSKGGARDTPPSVSNFFHFHAGLRENLAT